MCREAKDFHDVLAVTSEAGARIEIPLHAYVQCFVFSHIDAIISYLPAPDIRFDNFVNFGFVNPDSSNTKQINVYNEGTPLDGHFILVFLTHLAH